MKAKVIVLQQIIETTAGLYALSKDGTVWVYQGRKHGWSKLNMTAMSDKALKDKMLSSRTNHDSDEPF